MEGLTRAILVQCLYYNCLSSLTTWRHSPIR